MSLYEEQLEAKIRRQAAEITRLLAENKELKKNNFELSVDITGCKSMVESARAAGQEEAWKLAWKIAYDGYRNNELKEIFGSVCLDDIFNLTYTEAAEKVAEWERKKEEICVGDVVTFYEKFGVVTHIDNKIRGITESGLDFSVFKENCTKTGRHIDVASMLAQIGSDYNE